MKNRRKEKPGRRPRAAPVAAPLAGWKLWRWRLLSLVAIPLLALALLELLLRLVGFGYPTSFLLPSSNDGHKTFVQNNQFGWRFFGKRRSRTPNPISILQEKPRDTVRIFVFGESAAFGDPQPAFGLSRVLQATLSLRRPEMKFEVVNTAMTAINSHVILPIARDCARAGGDIWVIYMGNNEVVGPFGAGTVFGPQAPPDRLIRMSLALKATRLGQLIDAGREKWQTRAADNSAWGGMSMFLDQQVSAGDSRMANVYRNFEKNLDDIIAAGHDSGAGVVVSTVAVNLKDCAPFASAHRAGLSGLDAQKCDELRNLGIQAQAAGRVSEAALQFQAAAQLDDGSADLQFRLGRCLLELGDISGAQRALSAARDLDTLRFRCDSRLNGLIRKATVGRDGQGILLADAEDAFAAASPDGVPGWDLFYEHVHLTFEGNCLLARTLAGQIEKLLPQGGSAPHPWPTTGECSRRLGRTARDLQPALAEILARLTAPPFITQINHNEQIEHLTAEARQLTSANDAQNMDNALRVAQAAIAASPDDAQLYEQLATMEETVGRQGEAETAARRAVALLPSSEEGWSQLGFTLVQEKKYSDAVDAYHRAFDLDSEDVWPLQNIAMALTKLGKTEEAIQEYRRALAITPHFGLSWLGLGQLLENTGHKEEAAACFQKGLQNPIHTGPELATLARFCKNRGWLEAAATNYSSAIQLEPWDPALRFEAGQVLAASRKHFEAAKRFEEAAQLSPASGQAHFMAGMEMGKSGRPADAAEEFREASRLMPELLEPRLNLGIALFQEQKWNEALDVFQQAAVRSPTNALVLHYLNILNKRVPAQFGQ
jgi:tetratricopeptide (TPR) repeat protein